MSIIDTLSEGFRIVTKKIWLIVLPVLLDLGLWWAPKVSIAQVVNRMLPALREIPDALQPGQAGWAQMFDLFVQQMQETIGRTNLLALLAWSRLGVPSIAGVRQIQPQIDHVVEITGYGSLLLAQFGIMVLGLLLACVFLGLLGQQVSEQQFSLPSLLERVARYWLYLFTLLALLFVALMIIAGVGRLLGPLGPFLWISALWLMFYFVFVPQAITMNQDRPMGALLGSFAVVRFNFLPTLGLLLLTNVISAGLALLWGRLLNTTVGIFLAILINAYVGTGLALAAFVFYRDRLNKLRQMVEQQRSATLNG